MKRTAVCAICLLGTAILMAGCSFFKLKKDLETIDELHSISGRIINNSPYRKPVVVALWGLSDGPDEVSSFWVVEPEGTFRFFRSSGQYYLFAFEDANEDGRYQSNEYAGAFGAPSIFNLDSDQDYEDLEIRLLPPGILKLPPSVLDMPQQALTDRFAWRKGQTGALTSMDNPLFTDETATMGLWQPAKFVEEIGMKIYFLEPYNPRKMPVLLVHGSSGHPGLWKPMIEKMDREKFQPWLTYYPSGMRLNLLGGILSGYLRELHLENKFDDLAVIAHSMGGLVARSMILQYAEMEERSRIPLYVTIATPWQGHSGANMGVRYAPAVVPAWYDMVPNSPFIRGIFSESLPPETAYHLFFAHQGDGGEIFGGKNNDGTVTLESQLFMPAQEAAERIYGIDAGHTGILSDTNTLGKLNRIFGEIGYPSAK